MPPESSHIPKPETAIKLQQAIALHQKGQLAPAQGLYEEILAAQPRHPDALHLLGAIAYQMKNYQAAVDLIGRAIEANPNNAAFYSNRGNALQALGQFEDALASYDRAIAIKPGYADAYYNRSNALKELKQWSAVIASYDQAININPNHAEAYYNRGNALQELKQFDAALASYDRAIAIKPDYADAYSNRGNALQEMKRFESALASYDQAIAIKPDYAEAYSNRGNSLKELKQFDAALASYEKALTIKPDYPEAYSNRGNAYRELKQFARALENYDQALAFKPDYAEVHWNKSLVFLSLGDFDRGWEGYEWRWKSEDISKIAGKRNFTQPLWLGREPLAGKTILLHSEQGFGDTIQFCRYAKMVAALGARVILEVQKPLLNLLANLEGVGELVGRDSPLPAFDFHCPLMSLPLAFKTNLDNIPSSAKYLSSDPGKQMQWQSRLGVKNKPRIGLVWSGKTNRKNDHNRSILLADLVKYLPGGFQYVSLQKEVRDIDKQTLESCTNILHFGDELEDFSDTAALCDLMDLVISVDTGVAHLSGALGKPTWILLLFNPDWRWLVDREDNPWYPTAKLYRQERIGDWDSVFERVKADLAGGNI